MGRMIESIEFEVIYETYHSGDDPWVAADMLARFYFNTDIREDAEAPKIEIISCTHKIDLSTVYKFRATDQIREEEDEE